MKTFTIDHIRSWNPCYNLIKHLPERWSGTVIDILKHSTIPPEDKISVICRNELINAKTLRSFAVECARQVQHLMKDKRSVAALDVSERYTNGQATDNELVAACEAAHAAACNATGAAAWEAAWAAAWATALAAAQEAAQEAAQAAAWAAAREAVQAAKAAAQAANWPARGVREASKVAGAIAMALVREAQIAKLIQMVEEGDESLLN
jgi:hypothetical protein